MRWSCRARIPCPELSKLLLHLASGQFIPGSPDSKKLPVDGGGDGFAVFIGKRDFPLFKGGGSDFSEVRRDLRDALNMVDRYRRILCERAAGFPAFSAQRIFFDGGFAAVGEIQRVLPFHGIA